MKPFTVPAWRQRHIRDKYNRKARVVRAYVTALEKVMLDAIDGIVEHAFRTGHFLPPAFNKMNEVTEEFYRSLITHAIESAKLEKQDMVGKKKLGRLPTGLPKRIKDVGSVLNDRKYWSKIMKRSGMLTDRMKRQYIKKLQKQFVVLMPAINSGKVSPAEVKKVLVSVWGASKPRVETIFRTETTKYFADTQIKFFSGDSDILGFLFDSVKDVARTEICSTRHGLIYRPGSKLLEINKPPCHYNCRSHLIALANTPFNVKLISERGRDPGLVHVAPLPKGWK
jgi:SPP1 gp7 family putative phage head morphogenesis protein